MTARTRAAGRELQIAPTLFRSAGKVALLCRLHAKPSGRPTGGSIDDSLRGLYHQGFDGIVFTNAKGVIQHVNAAFLALAGLPQLSDAKGKSLADFLARGSVDLKVLLEHTAASGRMRLYSTKLKSPFGAQEPVEISATGLAAHRAPLNAFVFRSISRGEVAVEAGNDEAMRNVMELVGSTPLKEIVAATADVVERMCIETAVELTKNNRVAAAELLGLSRQSLYVKLRKYGLVKSKDVDES